MTASLCLLTSSPSFSRRGTVSTLLCPDTININYDTHTCTDTLTMYVDTTMHSNLHTHTHTPSSKFFHVYCDKFTHKYSHTHTELHIWQTPCNQHYPCELFNGHLVKHTTALLPRTSTGETNYLCWHTHTHMQHNCVYISVCVFWLSLLYCSYTTTLLTEFKTFW